MARYLASILKPSSNLRVETYAARKTSNLRNYELYFKRYEIICDLKHENNLGNTDIVKKLYVFRSLTAPSFM